MNKGTSWIVAAAVISFLIAVYVWFTGDKDSGLFIGLWVPSLLTLATYLKKQMTEGVIFILGIVVSLVAGIGICRSLW